MARDCLTDSLMFWSIKLTKFRRDKPGGERSIAARVHEILNDREKKQGGGRGMQEVVISRTEEKNQFGDKRRERDKGGATYPEGDR